MKTKIYILFLFIATFSNAQPELKYLRMGWDFASPFLKRTKLQIDPSVFQMVDAAMPQLAKSNINGAVTDAGNVILKAKGLKTINPQFTKYLEQNFRKVMPLVKKQDYWSLSTILVGVAITTNTYIKKGTMGIEPLKQETPSPLSAEDPWAKLAIIESSSYINEFNDYTFVPGDLLFIDVSKIDELSGGKSVSENPVKYEDRFFVYSNEDAGTIKKGVKEQDVNALLKLTYWIGVNKQPADTMSYSGLIGERRRNNYIKKCNCTLTSWEPKEITLSKGLMVSSGSYADAEDKTIQGNIEFHFIKNNAYYVVYISAIESKMGNIEKDFEQFLNTFFTSY